MNTIAKSKAMAPTAAPSTAVAYGATWALDTSKTVLDVRGIQRLHLLLNLLEDQGIGNILSLSLSLCVCV